MQSTDVTLPPLPEPTWWYGPYSDMVSAHKPDTRAVETYPLFTAEQLLAERERCARLVESLGDPALAEIVQAIREGVEVE